ncbi:MAG: response regulator [Myxococcota bacterium]
MSGASRDGMFAAGAVIDQLPELYLVLDPTFSIVAVSDAYLSATMTRREQVVGRSLFEVFPDNPDDPHANGVRNLKASLERVRDTCRPDAMAVQKYDIRRPEAEGGGFEVRYWSPQNSPVMVDGRLAYIVHRAVDVTDFLLLRERAATQDSVNAELRTRADRSEEEIVARSRELQATNERLREAHLELETLNAQLEKRVHERTSELRAANLALRQEMDARAHAEEQFRQAQKMEAVGLLAGGIAHDFNNLLTVILSCSALLAEEIVEGHPLRRDLLDITESAERAAGLTRQLLTFSRRQVSSPTSVDLNEVVRQSVPFFRRLLGENVRLDSKCAPSLPRTRVDRGHVEQVLMNLVVNARDAMPLGGAITIETSSVELDEQAGGYLGAAPGSYVVLAVTDTGTGMAEETRARLFLPFFTTKGIGRGTGLGLSMVHGVVKQSHGELFVDTTLGAGTTFKVCFPVELEAAVSERASTAEPLPPPAQSAVILVVEDEEPVRDVTARILRHDGYTVLTASSPAQALARFADAQFELLLTDVVMPDMDGPTFVEKLAERRAEPFRVLFMSGYTGGTAVHQRVLESNAAFVQKPFTPRQLRMRVREALAAERQGAVARRA